MKKVAEEGKLTSIQNFPFIDLKRTYTLKAIKSLFINWNNVESDNKKFKISIE